MSVATMFADFIANLAISNVETISLRYGELTSALNKHFRDTESKTANTLQVGSFGRSTGIDSISDLDMLYFVPRSLWDDYKSDGQLKLLQDTKDAILARYPKTTVKVDRLVVRVIYSDFHVEVQPVFKQEDGSFKYPDTKNGGSWKVTKPREEMDAIAEMDGDKNSNLRRLCKMCRAWKNKHGASMGGLLIDTLAYNFLAQTEDYDDKSYLYYDEMCRDFFEYLSQLPKQDHYAAPGSGQHVKVKKPFQAKAKKAHTLCMDAIDAEDDDRVNAKWRKVFGRPFPQGETAVSEKTSFLWDNTEEFIEDCHPVDIRYHMHMECEVKQDGFREHSLRSMITRGIPLLARKKLQFDIVGIDVPEPYEIKWKVLNRGVEARRRNKVRGQIVQDQGRLSRTEPTWFKGDHFVECYAVKNGVVVARDRIDVPITTNADNA